MKRITIRTALSLMLALVLFCSSFTGCTENIGTTDGQDTQTQEQTESQEPEVSDQIADASESIGREDVVDEGMVPVPGSALKDGVYEIEVASSSSMFNPVSCTLTVAGDEMTADMTMSGTGYRYICLGTPEEAVAASESDYLYPEADADGAHHFILPVEALNKGIDCAAFSDNKEKWYDRILVFRAAGIPMSAFQPDFLTTVSSLGLADGSYTCEVQLKGGSGKASVASPANLTIRGGSATAEIVMSSDKYDYMIVDGVTYTPIIADGHSTFLIPMAAFDFDLPIHADTIAMSTPHLIDYTLYFDSSTIQ